MKTIPSTTTVKTTTKDEIKSNTKVIVNNNTNNKTETKNEVKQETPSKSETISSSSNTKEETKTPTSQVAKPELANSTYTRPNDAIVAEVIKILNDEISKDSELVDFGNKAVKGNKKDAYAKTTGFTYLFVNDINKGKVAGNYVSFPQRVRNNIGAFGNYNVYAEDEYTYDGRGLNPAWCQTLVWIYITF